MTDVLDLADDSEASPACIYRGISKNNTQERLAINFCGGFVSSPIFPFNITEPTSHKKNKPKTNSFHNITIKGQLCGRFFVKKEIIINNKLCYRNYVNVWKNAIKRTN